MFSYYLGLGLRSLRASPVLTLLMVLTLAAGVAASMSTFAVMRGLSGDPMPSKSERLLVVQVDNRPVDDPNPAGVPDDHLSWLDARALLEAGDGLRRSAMYAVGTVAEREGVDSRHRASGMAVGADFFPMFEVPFAQGGGWSAQDDARAGNVVVLSRAFAARVFGDDDPVGRSLRLFDREYQVVGVLGAWDPRPRYYWLASGSGQHFADTHDFFFPLSNAIAIEEPPQGNVSCNGAGDIEPGFLGLLNSECVFMQYWVELADASERRAYRERLGAYIEGQKALGRLGRGEHSRLQDVREWMVAQQVLDDDTRLQTLLAFGFLLLCVVNAVGLLLAKFSRSAGEIGVRRALGATRAQIFQQYLVQAGVIGLAGGVFGVLLTAAGLWLLGQQSSDIAEVARFDAGTLGLTLATAVGAAVLAGVLPTWRASRALPAAQLKTQ